MLRLPFRRPVPEPDPPSLTLPPWTLGIYAAFLGFLVAAKFGHVLKDPNRLDRLWLVWPFALLSFFVAREELDLGFATWEMLNQPADSLVYALPIAGFALLLISEIFTWLFSCLGPSRAFATLRHPVMCVHTISLTFYWNEPIDRLPIDVFGRPLHPLRYIMWTISVSSMCYSLYLVAVNVLRPALEAGRSELRHLLIDSLIGCYITFVSGLLASIVNIDGSRLPNVFFFIVSSLGFYLMLVQLLMLLSKLSNDERVVKKGMSSQFQAISFAVTIVWHIFPVVWLLGAFNVITVFQEHVAYICCDLCAKYLLLFVYTNHVNA